MKIERFEKQKNNKYKVVGDETLTLFDETILKFDLLVKHKIDKSLLKEVMDYDHAIEQYYKIIKSIKNKIKTETEIIRILKNNSINDNYIDLIINKLKQINLLNNDIYVSSYINDEVNLKTTGPRKIETDLLALGFEDQLIKKYLNNIELEIWIQKINKIIQKKLKANHSYSGQRLKVKIAMDIVHLGYTKEMVMNEINKYDYNNNDILIKEYAKQKRLLSKKYQNEDLEKQIIYKMYAKGYSKEDIETLKK